MSEIPPPVELSRIGFLVGHFRGAGTLRDGRVRVDKECRGAWEAGGHFLSLRMVASYFVGERLADRHEALVLVGAHGRDADFSASAYTDGGGTHGYALALEGDALVFEDRPPHGSKAMRARKTIAPTAEGYLERLDVETAAGAFEPYATIELRRV